MAKYGKTYWGEQFLNALSHIDYSNRLPRGRSYASNNSVKSIYIDKNNILAKVKGSRPKPYDVTIVIPEFSDVQKTRIIDIIKSDITILAALLNRQLPEDMLQKALQDNIRIFPQRWDDFKMNCSCPDWAVPCKHLAAVIYLTANEIDLNPFLVLSMRGLDVIDTLKNAGLETEHIHSEKIESWDALFSSETPPHLTEFPHNQLAELDYSTIPFYGDTFLQLLSKSPPFYDSDFKFTLIDAFKRTIKNAPKKIFESLSEKPALQIQNCTGVSFISDEDNVVFEVELKFDNRIERIRLSWLLALFSDEERFNPILAPIELQVLYHFYLFAQKLIVQGALVPQPIILCNFCSILWHPLENDAAIKLQLDNLVPLAAQISIAALRGNKRYYLSDANKASLIISTAFSSLMMTLLATEHKSFNTSDFILNFFFGTYWKYEGKHIETINSVQLWLNKILSRKRMYIPVLEVSVHEFDFYVSLSVRKASSNTIETPLPFQTFKKKHKEEFLALTKEFMFLQQDFPEIKTVLKSTSNNSIVYGSSEFADFLLKISPLMQLLGVEILLPKSLKNIIKPAVSIKARLNKNDAIKSYMDLMSMLDFEWQVAVGDELIPYHTFLSLVKGMDGIVKIKDMYVLLNKDDLSRLAKNIQPEQKLSRHQLLQVIFANEYEGNKIEISPALKEIIKSLNSNENVPLPSGLLGQMRPYQLRGYEWLFKNSTIGFGSILADDMGLGKTYQAIALLLKFKNEGFLKKHKALIVVPTTLLYNWGKEIQKFAPMLKFFIYHGGARTMNPVETNEIVITSYGVVRSDAELLKDFKWHVIIIDEAQNIKNHNTLQTKAVKALKAPVKIALSGTPVENRLSEYWSIFDFTNKGYLGSLNAFVDDFAKPIAIEKSQKRLSIFRKITAPFIMRRLKTDKNIISDLPDKIETNQYCFLSKEQAALYKSTVNNALETIANKEGIERKGLVLKMLTALKQIGNHPRQFLKSGADAPELSGKVSSLLPLLTTILENNEKTLIFTQYKEMGILLQNIIRTKLQTEPLFLHGSLSTKERNVLVEDFQNKPHRKIFILSLKAGGTGLNLTAAQHVIHFDLWWNPAVERQATDRAYRIGQKNKVMVYRLINKGTLEERIDEMLKDKGLLADLAVSSGEKWLGELNNSELKELVQLSKTIE